MKYNKKYKMKQSIGNWIRLLGGEDEEDIFEKPTVVRMDKSTEDADSKNNKQNVCAKISKICSKCKSQDKPKSPDKHSPKQISDKKEEKSEDKKSKFSLSFDCNFNFPKGKNKN